jgi:hypothetical protein
MTRVRWLAATWPCTIRTLASRLRNYPFGNDANDGFLLDRVRDQFIEGRHVEKIVVEEVVRDPFGNETTFNRLSYREVAFIFAAAYPQVELQDFPRGLQTFIARTAQATDFTTAFLPISINAFHWADTIRALFPTHFRIDLAQLSDVFIEDGVLAKMILSSEHDVRAAFSRFTNRRSHTVDRIQVNLEHDQSLLRLQLASDGTIRSNNSLPKEVLEAIRRTLPASTTQGADSPKQ